MLVSDLLCRPLFLLTSCVHIFAYLSDTGDKWDEERRRNWNSDKNVCDWAGISCNDTGEIIGLSFPTIDSI